MMTESRPAAYRFWPESARAKYDERIGIMREGNNIPDSQTTPNEIIGVAIQQAEEEVRLIAEKSQRILI